jgi:5-methylcytosine-specific restriction endonuclease McrA
VRKNKLIDKKIKKRVDGKCVFCGEDRYYLLDCHRIIPGEEGGKYIESNICVCCSNCHRKIHSKRIKIIGKYYCTSGKYVVNCIIDDEEFWLEA